MDKQDFLKKLRKSLRRKLAKQEIRDILTDYEGFFISGITDGKSEEEICADLGNPDIIALELAKELPDKQVKPLNFKFIVPKWRENEGKIRKADKIILSSQHIILLFISIAVYYFMYKIIPALREWAILTFEKDPDIIDNSLRFNNSFFFNIIKQIGSLNKVGSFLLIILRASIIIAIILAIIAAYRFYRSTPYYFAVIVHVIGTISLMYGILHIIRDLNFNNPNVNYHFRSSMEMVLSLYCISILITLISAFLVFILSRRAKK